MAQALINEVTGTQDRSTGFTKLANLESVRATPVGAGGERDPNVAANAKPQKAVYFARNMSAVIKRHHVKFYVTESMDVYPEEVLKHYRMDTNQLREVCKKKNMNIYDFAVQPQRKGLRLDDRPYVIDPAMDAEGNIVLDEPGPWTPIPEGLWTLYVGDWDRMHDPDPKIRTNEQQRVNNFVGDSQPVFVHGAPEKDKRPSAYIEFKREEITIAPVATGNEMVFADAGIEI